mmetsp:Transcript_54373/g.161555  ORF Transcript_54373/g.161555 Transcript_54373/m.161555 type:complete len:147 (-) Transcript_54373:1252-1692(-)
MGEEPTQVQAAHGSSVLNVVLSIAGALVMFGVGQEPGTGTCHNYWTVGNLEVDAGTALAKRRVRGGTGDLQLRLDDGREVWYSCHHCRPWQLADGEPFASTVTQGTAPEPRAVATPIAAMMRPQCSSPTKARQAQAQGQLARSARG